LSGDCEADNWDQIVGGIPGIPSLAVFQAPHHGAVNGVFTPSGDTPWLDALPAGTRIAMSSHIRPHNHPAPEVVAELGSRNIDPFRTDLHYHLTFSTDGTLDLNGSPVVVEHWSHSS
jgi:beta-lactamase superfamily II metal-dependent hydrolase